MDGFLGDIFLIKSDSKKKKKENLNSPTALNRLNQRFKTPQSKRPKWQKMKNSIL